LPNFLEPDPPFSTSWIAVLQVHATTLGLHPASYPKPVGPMPSLVIRDLTLTVVFSFSSVIHSLSFAFSILSFPLAYNHGIISLNNNNNKKKKKKERKKGKQDRNFS
jgi:hypothetical protein